MRLLASLLLLCLTAASALAKEYDVVVYGGSPAGVMAAVAAARDGASVVVIEPTRWIGGMVAGGLSSSDLGNPDTIGGLALEFFDRCGRRSSLAEKWYSEPHVYQAVFAEMLSEAGVEVVTGQRLKSTSGWRPHLGVDKAGVTKIEAILTQDGREWRGKVFVDATYEGDLMASAGVRSIVGRESHEAYGEELAGYRLEKVRDFPLETMTQGCPCVGGNGPHYVHGAPTRISARSGDGKLLWGVTSSSAQAGSADRLTQSYNFRLCVTRNPENLVPWPKPLHYEPSHYELLLRLIQAYPGIPFSRIVHLGKLANGKFDLNAQGLFSTDYVGGNAEYPDGDPAARERIWQDHLDYVQGLFWFLAHDERVPEALRKETNSWGLCRDEFADNDHWPYALYVREARRMLGAYVMTQRDVQRDIVKADSVGMGSFIIDSHIVQRIVSQDGIVLDEGAFDAPTRPYQIPYRSLTPKAAECENLLVPVCLSASHIAYGSIRMEPVYMALGHAAGLAAAAAARGQTPVQKIDVEALREKLRAQHQILELKGLAAIVWPESLPGVVVDDDKAVFTGAWTPSSFGDPIGGSSRHDGNAGKGEKTARFELTVPRAGRYEVRIAYTPSSNRATNVPIRITHAHGVAEVRLNERLAPSTDKYFSSVGVFEFEPSAAAVVELSNAETDGYVVADAVQLLAVP